MDRLVRAITSDGLVQAVAVTTRDLTERARTIHTTLPVATAALGRTLAAASMLGNALKEPNASLTLQIKGGGPLGTVLAVSDAQGNVRGYVQQPHVDLPLRPDGKLDVGSAVGFDGTLTVMKDLCMKEPYIGSVQLLGADSHRLRPWRAGGQGSEREGGGRLYHPAAARRGRGRHHQGGGRRAGCRRGDEAAGGK